MSSDTAELLRQHVEAVAKAVNPEKPDREPTKEKEWNKDDESR